MTRMAGQPFRAAPHVQPAGLRGEARGRAEHRVLWATLARDDDTPEMLAIALAAVEARLAGLSPVARMRRPLRKCRAGDATAGAGTPRGEGNGAATDAAAQILVPWFAGVGLVLRRIAQAATSDREPNSLLFGVYARCYAPGSPSDVLRAMAENAASSDVMRAAENTGDADDDLSEALFLRLALSCFPESLFPEIVGYTLAEISTAERHCARLRARLDPVPGWLGDLAVWAGRLSTERPVMAAALKSVRCGVIGADRKTVTARIARGVALHKSLSAQVWRAFEDRVRRSGDLAGTLQQLLRCKAPYAAGYHAQVMLAGRSLDTWFGERPFRAEAFLLALAASPWVDRDAPERSRLLKLLAFDGPMFGVFTADEEAVLRGWLAGLARPNVPAHESSPIPCVGAAMPTADGRSDAVFRASAQHGMGSRCAREVPAAADSRRLLFHALVNLERHPSALPVARRHVERCLRWVACDLRHRWSRFRYAEPVFEAWLDRVYQRQIDGPARVGRVPRLPRDAYVYGIEQLAPAILVDGCWLQRADTLAAVSPPVARRLAAIYADELGNGMVVHHHARIYRKLLESLGIDCPPVGSVAFAMHSRFLDAAFDLPVLLLAISVHSHRFLPELLGLNLAIELSGLGKSYREVARDLDHWGIDARIVRLHQSIDNLASGHAALARETITLHLRQVHGVGGDQGVQEHWRRIQRGYDLLRVTTRGFQWRLVTSYLARGLVTRLHDLEGSLRHTWRACFPANPWSNRRGAGDE